ncbi:DNA protection during starvation protein [Abditibacteriota bacterium]|nr:DNA protection during starvation protein [Abditibacteriota bacterium]
MAKNSNGKSSGVSKAIQPLMHQRGPIIQEYGTLRNLPLGLEDDARKQMIDGLNQILADTIMLASMYKKHHWQVSGHTFYQLHLLFDKHYEEQSVLVDSIAERISLLGGVTNGMPAAVAKITKVENPPDGVEEVPVQISRLLEAHELIMRESRDLAEKATEVGDDGTNDLIVSDVLRTNEFQTWFVVSHVVPEPLVKADSPNQPLAKVA